MTRKCKYAQEIISNIYNKGMLDYEQICEKVLVDSDFSEREQIKIQTDILDEAQNLFEQSFNLQSRL